MKKSISSLFCFLLALATWGQPITLNPDSVYVEADAVQPQIEAVCSISNVSAFELNVDWQWNSIEVPQGWSVEFCENNGCYPSSTDTIFHLGLDETAQLSAIFYPNGIPGTGEVKIRLYSASPGIHIEERAVFVAVVTGPSSASATLVGGNMTLFPNPAQQVLNLLVEDAPYAQWQIVDLTGKQRLGAPLPSHQVDIQFLPPGIYIFQAMTAEGQIIATKFFVKE